MTSSEDSDHMIDAAGASNAAALIARGDVVDDASTTEANSSGQSTGGSGTGTTSFGPSPSTAVAMIM